MAGSEFDPPAHLCEGLHATRVGGACLNEGFVMDERVPDRFVEREGTVDLGGLIATGVGLALRRRSRSCMQVGSCR